MSMPLDRFDIKHVYLAKKHAFERYCKHCNCLVKHENVSDDWIRVFCSADKCVRR